MDEQNRILIQEANNKISRVVGQWNTTTAADRQALITLLYTLSQHLPARVHDGPEKLTFKEFPGFCFVKALVHSEEGAKYYAYVAQFSNDLYILPSPSP